MSFRHYNSDTADKLGDLHTTNIQAILNNFSIAADKAGYNSDELAALLHMAALGLKAGAA